jgi:hypothetical protein
MANIRVDSAAPFGGMANATIRGVMDADEKITRLNAAVNNAESGFSGTAGTQFEDLPFGVTANATPGDRGSAWAYAIQQLSTQWTTFMTAAKPYLDALDNG